MSKIDKNKGVFSNLNRTILMGILLSTATINACATKEIKKGKKIEVMTAEERRLFDIKWSKENEDRQDILSKIKKAKADRLKKELEEKLKKINEENKAKKRDEKSSDLFDELGEFSEDSGFSEDGGVSEDSGVGEDSGVIKNQK